MTDICAFIVVVDWKTFALCRHIWSNKLTKEIDKDEFDKNKFDQKNILTEKN